MKGMIKVERKYVEYENNQYEDIEYSNVPKDGLEARYIRQEEPEYQGNMLIEALPPARSLEIAFKEINRRPIYSEKECYMDNQYRFKAIMRLRGFICVQKENIIFEECFDRLTRTALVNKNIDQNEFRNEIKNSAQALRKSKNVNRDIKRCLVKTRIDAPPAPTAAFIGLSGAGKTTAANMTLSYYPQVIYHPVAEAFEYGFTQIVWLKIECSHNGSLKAMLRRILSAIDEAVDTDLNTQYQKASVETLIEAVKYAMRYYAVATLIIDEVQHIGKSENSMQTFNGLVTIANEINIAIIYIGTYQVMNTIFKQDGRHARRFQGEGLRTFSGLKEEEFDAFMKRIWKYQWLNERVELSKEICSTFYDKTLGIADYIVKLFMMVQMQAIITGEEKISVKLIKEVADEYFPISKQMLQAIKEGDLKRLAKCQDLIPINVDIFYDNEYEKLETSRAIKRLYENKQYLEEVTKEEMKNDLIIHFSDYGYSMEIVEQIVDKVMKKEGNKQRVVLIKKIASELLKSEVGK